MYNDYITPICIKYYSFNYIATIKLAFGIHCLFVDTKSNFGKLNQLIKPPRSLYLKM